MESVVEFESYRVCLADSLKALWGAGLGKARPGRLITEAGNELMSRPALRSVGLEEKRSRATRLAFPEANLGKPCKAFKGIRTATDKKVFLTKKHWKKKHATAS